MPGKVVESEIRQRDNTARIEIVVMKAWRA